jgi:hypothetical protein
MSDTTDDDLARLKRPGKRGRLPPPITETHTGIITDKPARARAAPPLQAPPESEPAVPKWIDGRTLRATGRTYQFSTRVSEAYNIKVRAVAAEQGLMLTEVLEESLAALTALIAAVKLEPEPTTPGRLLNRLLDDRKAALEAEKTKAPAPAKAKRKPNLEPT